MKDGRLLHGIIAASIIALTSLLGVPSAHAAYYNGAFHGQVTGAGGTSAFTLPAGAIFPQVTLTDFSVGADTPVTVRTGETMDFTLTLGEFAEMVIPGTMRYTFFQLDPGAGGQILLLGTYTLTLHNDSGDYPVSGPVIGDQYGIYLAGKNDGNTPGVTTDDENFLARLRISNVGSDPDKPTLLGRAQVIKGTRVISTWADPLTATTTFAGTQANLAPDLANGSTFNQILTPDVVLGVDTPAAFFSNITRTGTIGAGDPYTTTSHALRLMPGTPTTWGAGLGLTRFTRTVPGGKTFEGFVVFDVAAPAGASSATEGYVFALLTPQSSPALLFGTLAGAVTGTGATATITAELRAVDSVPPDALPGDTPTLYTDRYQEFHTGTSDLNGWKDLKSAQLMINDSRTTNRIVAQYDAGTNRFSLYNKTLGTWTAACIPGSSTTLKTPWVNLSCKNSSVSKMGEFLSVRWNIKPTAKMLGSWSAYLKATDREGQVAGWRDVGDEPISIQAHP